MAVDCGGKIVQSVGYKAQVTNTSLTNRMASTVYILLYALYYMSIIMYMIIYIYVCIYIYMYMCV